MKGQVMYNGTFGIAPEVEWIVPTLDQVSLPFWAELLPLAGEILIPLFSTLVGALIALHVASRSASRDARLEAERHARFEKVQWYTLMQKAATLASDLDSIATWISVSLERANKAGLTGERLWQRINGLAGSTPLIEINPADLVPLIEADEHDLMFRFNYVVGQHASIASSASYYTKRREALADRIKSSKSFKGSLLISALSQTDQQALEPIMAELDSLAAQIRDRVPALLQEAFKLVEDLGPAGQKYFKDPNFRLMKMEAYTQDGN